MFIPVRKLLKDTEVPFEQSGTFDFTQEDFADCTIETPVAYEVKATPYKGAVEIELHVKAVAQGLCARCTEGVERHLVFDENHIVREADLLDEDAELPFTEDGALDVRELVYQALVLNIPPIILCKEDCGGLCQRCGQPVEQCNCASEETGDPRLQVLRDLLKEEE